MPQSPHEGALNPERTWWIAAAVVLLLGLGVRVWYFLDTPYLVRAHDVEAHINYLRVLALEGRRPTPAESWLSYHPPLYYLVMAGAYRLLDLVGWNEVQIFRALQALSLAAFLGFLVAAATLAKRWIATPSARIVGLALVVCWPSGILHAGRLGNDVFLYLFYGLGFWFLVRWYEEQRRVDLLAYALFAALAVATKSNGAVLVVVGGVVGLCRGISGRARTSLWRYFLPIHLVLGFLVVLLLSSAPKQETRGEDWLCGNEQTLPLALAVENPPSAFLWFDLATFLREPYARSWEDNPGRHYFWNYLCKTSLLSSYEYPEQGKPWLLLLLDLLFLAVTAVAIFGLGRTKPTLAGWYVPALANLGLGVFALAVFRLRTPYISSNEFRYILPVLLSLPPFFVAGCEGLGTLLGPWGDRVARGVALGFCLTSLTFFATFVPR